MSREKYEKIFDEVIELKKKIANIVEKTTPVTVTYRVESFLKHIRLNWKSFFEIISTLNTEQSLKHSNIIGDNDFILVYHSDAIRKTLEVIQKTSKHVVFNYFWLKALSYWWNEVQPKNQDSCYRIFDSAEFPLILAINRLYVDYSLKNGSKSKLVHMFHQLKRSAIESMEKNTIIDEKTRQRAIEKLRNIIDIIGFPEWLIIDEHLDDFYGIHGSLDSLIAHHYCISYIRLMRYFKYQMFRIMKNKDFSFREINFSPLMANAFYNRHRNSIEIEPTLLKLPLFDAELPFYVNYAKLGSIIAHEITHSFDKEGINYDKNGVFQEWWTNKSLRNFENRTQCFIEQYRNYSEHSYGLWRNNSTLSEDIADNGGLRLAYMAYQNELKSVPNLGKQPQLLPRLVDKKMTVDQIFFLSLAQIECGVLTNVQLKDLINKHYHSPPESRVNLCMQNFDKFAESFNCSMGSPMNPKKRCLLW
uniref:Neprilysin-1-like n=1 Tax=Dermatophagoides pteronyssinus TaxID=6956 RepID=A0A6P6XRL6_DERPT|nr:neprilysin-1-like [Dermatophagoides pteronyssinus]